jgi:hypothetical protein
MSNMERVGVTDGACDRSLSPSLRPMLGHDRLEQFIAELVI